MAWPCYIDHKDFEFQKIFNVKISDFVRISGNKTIAESPMLPIVVYQSTKFPVDYTIPYRHTVVMYTHT